MNHFVEYFKKIGADEVIRFIPETIRNLSYAFVSSMVAVMFVNGWNENTNQQIFFTLTGFLVLNFIGIGMDLNFQKIYKSKNSVFDKCIEIQNEVSDIGSDISMIRKVLSKSLSKPKLHIRLKAKKS